MVRKFFLPGLMAIALLACNVSPTGRQQLALLSPQQLEMMGVTSFEKIKLKKPILIGGSIDAYVKCVTRAITDQLVEVGNGQMNWEVVVFHDQAANAFALPGGKIGVNSGLLKIASTQDQLAAVVGHEIAHVMANHTNERLSQELAVQGGLNLASILASEHMSQVGFDTLMQALGLGAQIGILLPYSRVHESEADVMGLSLMAQAGFDPRESITLWRNMEQINQSQPLEFLSTHPSHSTRISDLAAHMETALRTYETARTQGRRPRCGRRIATGSPHSTVLIP